MESVIKKCLPTYEVIGKIGAGVYGTVYHVRDNLKERAVKVVPIMVERSLSHRTPNDLDSKISHDFYAVQEYYQRIKGDGVIEIYDFHLVDKQVSHHEAKAFLVILMEFCPHNLVDRVIDNYPLSPRAATLLMLELAQVLKRLSYRTKDAFIVKDLKPSNLLITKDQKLIIGDLGGLQRLSSTSASTNAQFTPNWSAPELITHSDSAGIASLVFSYGFVSYFIWFGGLPYEKAGFSERLRLLKEQGVTFDRADIPFNVQILISQCVSFNPEDRPGDLDEILTVLNEYMMPNADLKTPESPLRRLRNPGPPSGSSRPEPKKKSEPDPVLPSRQQRQKNPGPYQVGDTWVEPVTGMEFVWVPTGSFQMGGGSWDGEGNRDEHPLHEVYIDGFWLARYPVTQDQWKQVMASSFWKKVKGNNPSWFKQGGDYPVEQVSWHDAQELIARLAAVNKNRYHFRLPTEAEWEYAARSGGRAEKYSGGISPEEVAWYSANSGMTTHPVGTLAPNGLGLYDMSGNIYEWCADLYHEDAYRLHDPKNPINTAEGSRRIIRGGSWCSFSSELRCAYRASVQPDFKGNYIGLRLVMTPMSRKRQEDFPKNV